MLKSRTTITVIGVIVIGSASAIGVLLAAANSGISTHPTTAHTVSTATNASTQTRISSPTSGAAAMSTPTPISPRSTQPPSGQIIDLHGTITSTPNNDQFTYKDTAGKTWTVRVTSSTTYEGATRTFSGLQAGMKAEVSGVPAGATTFLAYHVNAENP